MKKIKAGIRWIKHRLEHKLEHFSKEKLKKFLKENGLAFVVIFLAWEIIEDVLFPAMFLFLVTYLHPVFHAAAPAHWIPRFHLPAVPVLMGM